MKPGDKLYFACRHGSSRNQWLTVEKIGRRWVYFHERPRWKMDRKTRDVFEGELRIHVGHCCDSEEAYWTDLAERQERWSFRKAVQEADLTDLAAVRRAAEILGIEL